MNKANLGKRRNVYNSLVEPAFVDYPQDATDLVQESPYGGIDLSYDEFYQIQALFSRYPPSSRPGGPPKPPLRPQSQQSGPKSPSKGMMGPSIYHQVVESGCNESIEGL